MHQRLVVADRRQGRLLRIILLQVGGLLPPLDRLHELRRNVARVLRQLEIFQKPLQVVFALRAIEQQPVIEHMGLERIVDRIERRNEIPQPIEIRRQRRRILPPIHIVRRRKPRQIRVDEVLLVAQFGLELQQFVELREQQQPMNLKLPESAAVDVVQIIDDQFDQIRIIGPRQHGEQTAPLIGRQLDGDQPIDGRRLEALHRGGKLARMPVE